MFVQLLLVSYGQLDITRITTIRVAAFLRFAHFTAATFFASILRLCEPGFHKWLPATVTLRALNAPKACAQLLRLLAIKMVLPAGFPPTINQL